MGNRVELQFAGGLPGAAAVELRDLVAGRRVYSETLNPGVTGAVVLDLPNLPPGQYAVMCAVGENRSTRLLTIAR